MSSCHRILSVIQIVLLAFTYLSLDESSDVLVQESIRTTIHCVLLVHSSVSAVLALKSTFTPNTIGLSFYTLAGSLSLGFISYMYMDGVLLKCSIALTTCGFLSFAISWWKVYNERFQTCVN